MDHITIGSDHAGFPLKEKIAHALRELGYTVLDMGTASAESCDYPGIAHNVCSQIEQKGGLGILICGTGIGMSITANRHAAIRAALCTSELQAALSRRHNNANVLCLGARITGEELALAILAAFLAGEFEGGRHERRIGQINSPDINHGQN